MPYGEAPWIFTGRYVSSIPWSVGHECGLGERGRSSGSHSFPAIDFAGQTTALLFFFFFFFSTSTTTLSPSPPLHRALYQLQLVPLSEAKKHIPPEFRIVSLFG